MVTAQVLHNIKQLSRKFMLVGKARLVPPLADKPNGLMKGGSEEQRHRRSHLSNNHASG